MPLTDDQISLFEQVCHAEGINNCKWTGAERLALTHILQTLHRLKEIEGQAFFGQRMFELVEDSSECRRECDEGSVTDQFITVWQRLRDEIDMLKDKKRQLENELRLYKS